MSTKSWNFTLWHLSHSHRWGSPESPSAVSGCQRKLLIILFFILSNSALLSDCYWRLIWKQSEGRPLISIQYGSLAWWQEHLSFWHCLWQYPGAALSPLSFPPAQRLVSTARTCILSAPYLSNHPSPSSTLPSQSVLLSQLLPNFPWLPQGVITVISSGVLGIT